MRLLVLCLRSPRPAARRSGHCVLLLSAVAHWLTGCRDPRCGADRAYVPLGVVEFADGFVGDGVGVAADGAVGRVDGFDEHVADGGDEGVVDGAVDHGRALVGDFGEIGLAFSFT